MSDTCPDCGAELAAGATHACRGERATQAASPLARSSTRAPVLAAPADLLAPSIPVPDEPSQPGEEFDPRIGTLLGAHYRILERLGAGGMGTVYLVVHVHLKKKFAAKILNPETARRPDALARFQQEAVSASRLDHENIVDVVNFGVSDDGTVYLVMEFLRGETLNQLLVKGPLSADDAARVTVPICRALAAAHGAGIVHRDLKPENVFVARRSGGKHVIKILDFGVSKIKEGATTERRLTQTGDVLGSPLYMSPEGARGDANVDGRADIYAVGVMLFEMMTGEVPFTAPNYLQVLYKHIQEAPPSPRRLRAEIPEALEAVILKALAKGPAARFQRMDDLEAALLAALPEVDLGAPVSQASPVHSTSADAPIVPGSGPSAPATAVPVREPAPIRPSRRGVAVGFAGTLALLAAGGIYWLERLRTEPPPAPIAEPRPTPAAIPPPVVSPPPPSPEPEPAVLSVESEPVGAEVTLDGKPLGQTPLGVRIDADGREHTVKVELAGFRAESRQVLLDRDRAVAVVLKKRDRQRPATMDIKEGR